MEKKWSILTTLKGTFLNGKFGKCYILNGELIIMGVRLSNFEAGIYKFNGSWAYVTTFYISDYNWQTLSSYKFKNKIYFGGLIDSVSNTTNPGIIEFDGSNINPTGLQPNWLSVFADNRDTLFVAIMNKVYFYNGKNWVFYQSFLASSQITGFEFLNGEMYVSDSFTRINKYKIKN
ncbi:MAG: hypothetical protein R2852_03475 [Bacteroidia bacterium]